MIHGVGDGRTAGAAHSCEAYELDSTDLSYGSVDMVGERPELGASRMHDTHMACHQTKVVCPSWRSRGLVGSF